MSHGKECSCPVCILAGDQPCDSPTCVASKGHAGDHVSIWQAPKLLARLLAVAVAKKIGGAQ